MSLFIKVVRSTMQSPMIIIGAYLAQFHTRSLCCNFAELVNNHNHAASLRILNLMLPKAQILSALRLLQRLTKVRVAGCGLRATDCGLRVGGHRLRAAGMRATDCGLRATDCGLRATNCGYAGCGPQIADCGLRATDCRLRVCGLRVTDCRLWATGCGLRAKCVVWVKYFDPSLCD